jgi:peptidyl-prolyl cis-trans isomerase C
MTRKTSTSLAALLLLSTFIGFAPAYADEAKIVATVDGATITEADLTLTLRDLAPQFERIPEEARRPAALQALIEIKLMAAKAKADGLDQSEDYKRQAAFLTERVLHQEAIDKIVQSSITEEDVRKRYDEEIAARPAENEVNARHILVKTVEEATKLIAELDGGADFKTLADNNTTDPSGKGKGGDLGWFGPGMMVPEFDKAAFETAPGSYTKTPVETQFGFHVIKVEDKRVKQPPAFEEVKDQIRAIVLRERYTKAVTELRTAAKVEITDEALKKALEPVATETGTGAGTEPAAKP